MTNETALKSAEEILGRIENSLDRIEGSLDRIEGSLDRLGNRAKRVELITSLILERLEDGPDRRQRLERVAQRMMAEE